MCNSEILDQFLKTLKMETSKKYHWLLQARPILNFDNAYGKNKSCIFFKFPVFSETAHIILYINILTFSRPKIQSLSLEIKRYLITHRFKEQGNLDSKPEKLDKMPGIATIAMWYLMKGSYLQF